jgi:DNA-binding transcriptional MerR regulator/methylmalonyl-CoA mutase cobalamin-binding subunit
LFTIKQAARLTGVCEATLRTWEKRYAVVVPVRTPSGYRLYDNDAIAALTAMRKLVDAGWAPAEASRAVRDGSVPIVSPGPAEPVRTNDSEADAATYSQRFLASAAGMDAEGIDRSLDRGFALGSFEQVVDAWLCPALVALGEGWARGEVDVAGEHAASHAVLRRLSAAFEAAGSRSRSTSVVVGLPPGSRHELGALAFATASRRLGLNVLYLGPDVPPTSWDAAVASHTARAAVLGVVTAADRPSAAATAELLLANHPGLVVASGGAFGAHLAEGVVSLPSSVAEAAGELDRLLHAETAGA